MFGRNKVAALVAEFLGTGVLTLLILSVQRSTIGVPFFVAVAGGLTLALMVFAVGAYSTGFFNPAITLALATARRLAPVTALLYIVVQFVGAYAAYGLYTFFVKSSLQDVGGHFTWRILVAEGVGTVILSFGIAAALIQRLSAAVTASMAGIAYVVGVIAASSAAIGLLNPALALGVRAWVWGTYVLGPIVGALVGVWLYNLVFAPVAVESAVVGAAAAPVAAPAAATATSAAARPAAKRRTASRASSSTVKRRTSTRARR